MIPAENDKEPRALFGMRCCCWLGLSAGLYPDRRERGMTATWCSRRLIHLLLLSAFFALTAPERAGAQSFPSRFIRIVVPTSVSTPPDIVSRVIATALTESEGWSVVVENKPGAVQTLGAIEVLKQPADGYTMLAV